MGTGEADRSARTSPAVQLRVAPGALAPVPVQALSSAPPQAQQQATGQDLLTRWAADMATLVPVPHPTLVGYGAAELAMQGEAPDCHLSWITLAALGRIGSEEARPQDGAAAALDTARSLCSGDRNTATGDGWSSAVRSVGDDPAHVHRVLAAATTYAVAVQSGVPISAPARQAIDFAIDQIGLPYVWGGNGPHRGDVGFDCSGLTTAAYATSGVSLPRTAHTQFIAAQHVGSADELRPGDLVFYGHPGTRIHHVGLYIGNGQMINAPTFGQPVQVAPVRWPGDDFAGAGRPVV